MLATRQGTEQALRRSRDQMRFVYEGADGLYRTVQIALQPSPAAIEETTARRSVRSSQTSSNWSSMPSISAENPAHRCPRLSYAPCRDSLDSSRIGFVGRHLVLLDRNTSLILDFLSNVLPSAS
jgi:hypothetical protein